MWSITEPVFSSVSQTVVGVGVCGVVVVVTTGTGEVPRRLAGVDGSGDRDGKVGYNNVDVKRNC